MDWASNRSHPDGVVVELPVRVLPGDIPLRPPGPRLGATVRRCRSLAPVWSVPATEFLGSCMVGKAELLALPRASHRDRATRSQAPRGSPVDHRHPGNGDFPGCRPCRVPLRGPAPGEAPNLASQTSENTTNTHGQLNLNVWHRRVGMVGARSNQRATPCRTDSLRRCDRWHQ